MIIQFELSSVNKKMPGKDHTGLVDIYQKEFLF